jgi:hypothetical protein
VLSGVVLSGVMPVSTDRMIASLRAQEPVRLVDRRRRGQAGEPTRRCTHQVSGGTGCLPGGPAGRRAPVRALRWVSS